MSKKPTDIWTCERFVGLNRLQPKLSRSEVVTKVRVVFRMVWMVRCIQGPVRSSPCLDCFGKFLGLYRLQPKLSRSKVVAKVRVNSSYGYLVLWMTVHMHDPPGTHGSPHKVPCGWSLSAALLCP